MSPLCRILLRWRPRATASTAAQAASPFWLVPLEWNLKESVLRLGGLAPAKCPSYDLSGEVCTHERAPRGLHTHGPGLNEALPSPQPTSHAERVHAWLGGDAALLKPRSGGKYRARSTRPVSHLTTAAVPRPLNPATQAGQCTPNKAAAPQRRAPGFPRRSLGAVQ